jgi:lysophospholipase L1-like esterase
MKLQFLAIFLLLAVGAGVTAWYLLRETTSELACRDRIPAPKVVAFGDSFVEGQGATTSGGFVSMLSEASGIPIKNLGRGGDTSATARKRIDAVLAEDPDVVIVLLGGNDALRRVPTTETETNLDSILGQLTASGSRVVLLGVLGGLPWDDPYPDMFERLRDKHQAVYVSNVLSGLIGSETYMSDSIHPNEAGYMRIAERVRPLLEKSCNPEG